jgi:hypothetical protein
MNFKGILIEESLEDKSILKNNIIKILKTEVEKVTSKHNTPWLSKWTKHTIEVSENKAMDAAEIISLGLDRKHSWNADFKNKEYHFIIFKKKIFCVKRENVDEYKEAKKYGMSLGIPEYQVDFSPEVQD